MSRGSKIFLAVLAVVFAVVGGGLYYVNDQLAGVPGEGDPVELQVPEGATAAGIGETLAERDVVKNALAFRLVARSRNLDSQLRAGTFDLETGMSVDEAIDALLGGPREPDSIRVTVPEGFAVPLTLERLAETTPHDVAAYQAVLDERVEAGDDADDDADDNADDNADDVLRVPGWVPDLAAFGPGVRHPFEGLLFPETYFFEADVAPRVVLQRMLEELQSRVSSLPEEDVAAVEEAGLSLYEGIVVASLVERETQVAEERGDVAGVIYNRLEEGMPLQIDATVLYALGRHKEQVLTEDTSVESPYNTYLPEVTLPPTPISGFGEASLRAAFAPADHDYLYYVLRAPECDGSHVFAETLEEHNENRQAYIDAGRCAADD